MMEAVGISKTSVYFHVTTGRYIPESCHIHIRLHKNLKSHRLYWFDVMFLSAVLPCVTDLGRACWVILFEEFVKHHCTIIKGNLLEHCNPILLETLMKRYDFTDFVIIHFFISTEKLVYQCNDICMVWNKLPRIFRSQYLFQWHLKRNDWWPYMHEFLRLFPICLTQSQNLQNRCHYSQQYNKSTRFSLWRVWRWLSSGILLRVV
jgi:hypothetical protein